MTGDSVNKPSKSGGPPPEVRELIDYLVEIWVNEIAQGHSAEDRAEDKKADESVAPTDQASGPLVDQRTGYQLLESM